MSNFTQFVLSWIKTMIDGFDGAVTNSVGIMTLDIFNNGSYNGLVAGDLYSLAMKINNYIKPVCMTIMTIVFLIEIVKLTMKAEVVKWEYLLRFTMKVVLAKVAIDVSTSLLATIYATSADWISQTSSGLNGSFGDTVYQLISVEANKLDFWGVLGLLISTGIVFLAIWIIGILIQVMAFARMIEIVVYITIAPLPCAFIAMEDSRITKKYFLAFAGVCLQGLFMLISISVFQTLATTALQPVNSTDISQLSYNLLMGAIVLVMCVMKSGTWAKSIVDAM